MPDPKLALGGRLEPDHGLWEARTAPRHYVHGKLMCWAALDRAIRLFGDNGRWEREREAIAQAVRARGIDPRGGHLLQAFDHPGTDAAVLLARRSVFRWSRRSSHARSLR